MEPSDTPTRELTLEEAVAFTILLQKNEHLVEAQELYRRVLAIAPHHPDALHYAGVLAHQQGRSDEGVARERGRAVRQCLELCLEARGKAVEGALDESVRCTRRLSWGPPMRNWEQYVRSDLSLPDLARERESGIVRELASQRETSIARRSRPA
jgi:hypothetical protein